MLDFFLVLGQIPGTNFQITFNEIMIALLFMFVCYYYIKAYRRSRQPQLPIIQLSSLHSFSYPISLKPVTPTRRIAEALQASMKLLRAARFARVGR